MICLAAQYSGAAFPARMNVRGTTRGCSLFEHTEIHMYDVQHIERLPFVFVNALDLNVEERIGMDTHTGGCFE